MLPTIIRKQLATLRQRERALTLVWGLARWFAAAVGLVVLICTVDFIIDRFSEEESSFLLHLLLLCGLVAAMVAGGMYFFWPLTRKLEDDDLSLMVEDKTPSLQHRLISAVQLNKDDADIKGMSPQLVAIVTEEAVQHSAKVSFPAVADHARLKRSAVVTVPALLVAAIPLAIAGPTLCGILLARLFLADVPIPRRVTVENATAAHHPIGKRLTIKVKAHGVLPGDRAMLYVSHTDTSSRQEMRLAGDNLTLALDVYAERAGIVKTHIDQKDRQAADVQQKTRQNAEKLAQADRDAEALTKQLRALVSASSENKAKIEDLRKTRGDLEKTIEVCKTIKGELEDQGIKLFAEQKKLAEDQTQLKWDVEAYARELAAFAAETSRRYQGAEITVGAGTDARDLTQAVTELTHAAAELDADNAEASFVQALVHLHKAQAVVAGTTIPLIQGDTVTFKLPLAVKGGTTWDFDKKDGIFAAEGDARIVIDPRSQLNQWVLQVKAASPTTGVHELHLKKDGIVKSFKFAVSPRQVAWYHAAVDAPTGNELSFHAVVGDGRLHRRANVSFLPLPVADVKAAVMLPLYCQTTPSGNRYVIEQKNAEVTGLSGSTVLVMAKAQNPLKSATLLVWGRDFDWLGARVTAPSKALAKQRGVDHGLLLTAVAPDSLAAKAGLRNQDILLKLGDRKISSDPEVLWKMLGEVNEGQRFNALINRDGQTLLLPLQVEFFADAKEQASVWHARRKERLMQTLDMKTQADGAVATVDFALRPNLTRYQIEVQDHQDFKNSPLVSRPLTQVPEKAPTVELLCADFSPQLRRQLKILNLSEGESDTALLEGMPILKDHPVPIAYRFRSDYGVGRAVLKYRVLKNTLGGSNTSDVLGLALDDAEGGALVRDIPLPNGMADKAKIRKEDLITQLGSKKIANAEDLIGAAKEAVKNGKPGDEIVIKVKRGSDLLSLTAVLGKPADDSEYRLPLNAVKKERDRTDFLLSRGVFSTSRDDDSINFHAIPSLDPQKTVGRKEGGGRIIFKTDDLPPGPLDVNDRLEYYIEVYPAENDDEKYRIPNRPIGRTATVTKTVADLPSLMDRIISATDERQVSKLLASQKEVFDTLIIGPAALPGTVGSPYHHLIVVAGGSRPLLGLTVTAFNDGGTGLPRPTVNLDKGVVTISGTPARAGTANFKVTVTDSSKNSTTSAFSVTVK